MKKKMKKVYLFSMGEYSLTFGEFAEWFLAQPLYGQVLVIVGIVALLVAACALVFYILKGIAYLIYYILKGVYYLLKGVVVGSYRIVRALYFALAGKPDPKKQKKMEEKVPEPLEQEKSVPLVASSQRSIDVFKPEVEYFCSECGGKFSERMIGNLRAKGLTFCEQCGKGFRAEEIPTEVQIES